MKSDRLNLIREIVTQQPIRTQEELAAALEARGVRVTQATISRDIKNLHLVKAQGEDGSGRYIISERNDQGISERMIRMLADSVVSMDSAGNLIVVRTLAGSAHVVGEAIDTLRWPKVVGTIAGDNTLLVIVRQDADVPDVL